jgi:hypothetical protein
MLSFFRTLWQSPPYSFIQTQIYKLLANFRHIKPCFLFFLKKCKKSLKKITKCQTIDLPLHHNQQQSLIIIKKSILCQT